MAAVTTTFPDFSTYEQGSTMDGIVMNTTFTTPKPPALVRTPNPEVLPVQECLATYAYLVGQWLFDNHMYVEVVTGFVGFLLVMIVYAKRMFKGTPYLYMCTLAIFDVAYLIVYAVQTKLMYAVQYNWGDYGCGLVEFFFLFFNEFAIGTLVIMTVERMLVISFPLKFQRVFTVKKALIALFTLAIVVFCLNFPIIFAKFVLRKPKVAYVYDFMIYRCFYTFPYPGFDTILLLDVTKLSRFFGFIFTPSILLFLCNISIVVTMARSAKEQGKMSAESGGKAASQLRHITAQMLSVSVSFVILQLIFCVMYFPDTYLMSQDPVLWPRCSWRYLSRFLAREIGKFFSNMQHAINAYMYCLVSAKFRKELLQALGILKKESSRQSRTTASTGLSSSVTNTALPPKRET